jgi:hypothetical protein
MKFETKYTSREHRYSLGVESESDRHFAAIPVSNRMVDYIESYAISGAEYATFLDDEVQAVAFAEACRRREHDDRLFMQPGTDRGVPR